MLIPIMSVNLLKYIHNTERSLAASLEESIFGLKVWNSMSMYIPNNADISFKYQSQSSASCKRFSKMFINQHFKYN